MKEQAWRTSELFDLQRPFFGAWLAKYEFPWDALKDIASYIREIGPTLDPEVYEQVDEEVWLAKSVKKTGPCYIKGPCIIGENTELRPGAFIRGGVLTGRDCVLGNSCEFKNCVLLDHVQVPHFSYVGDSVLGNDSHFGAGVITSNFRQDHGKIKIRLDAETVLVTDLRKMGAIVGDGCEIGCQAVLNPGSLVGRRARVYPLTQSRMAVPAHTILKNDMSLHILSENQ